MSTADGSAECPQPVSAATVDSTLQPYTLRQMVAYFLRLGSLGFGGPVALVGFMHRDLVERRKWISESDYKEGIALAQLAPWLLAAQLAIYLGYVHHRILGATLAGLAFVLPSFLMVVALGWAYVAYGGLSWMQAVFYGVGPCVIAIIAMSAIKLTRRSIGTDLALWPVYLASAACTIVTESEIVWLFLGAGILVWLIKAPPKWLSGRGCVWQLSAAPFLPCYFFTVIPAPYFKKFGHRPAIKAFVSGVTAAAIGAIAGAVVVLGRRTLLDDWQPDWAKVIMFLCCVGILWKMRKLPEPILVLASAIAGLIVFQATRG